MGKIFDIRRKFIWKLNRISKMSLSEIIYRIFVLLKSNIDKIKFKYINSREVKIEQNTCLKSIYNIENIDKNILEKKFQKEVQDIIRISEDIIDNNFLVFNKKIDFKNKIDWHFDKLNKKKWLTKFWSDINIREGLNEGGPKFIWEFNRFYFIPILGIAFFYTKEKKYADKIFFLIEDWLEKNTYPYGINWTSCIELSIRILNLLVGISFLKGLEFQKYHHNLINKFIYLHASHIYRYPSKYSSCNNHALAEALALFVSGLYFSNLKGSRKWLRFGKEVLDREVNRQILADGGSAEISVTYLSFTYDIFLLYKIMCDKNRIPYPSNIDEGLKKSANFIYALMDKGGNLPNIGDQDSAVLVNFSLSNWENFKSILNTSSILFKGLFLRSYKKVDIKTYILLGKNALKKREGVNSIGKKIENVYFKQSGIAVMQNLLKGREIKIYGNCSPMGMKPLYAHGHLDALSFMLSIDGYEIFMDPGTYLYHSGGKWRKYFRSNCAHNTIRVNNLDFSEQRGDFMYGKPYKLENINFIDNSNYVKWEAENNTYKKQIGVSHKRIFTYKKRIGKFEIKDIFYSRKNNFEVELFFHLHPGCIIDIEKDTIKIQRNGYTVFIYIDSNLDINNYYGSYEPLLGWYSREFNEIEKTNTIVCSGNFEKEKIIYTKGVIE
jgi:hypothetical protein